jgi:LysR family hydrogen peroxide-inducible transcriptional activator
LLRLPAKNTSATRQKPASLRNRLYLSPSKNWKMSWGHHIRTWWHRDFNDADWRADCCAGRTRTEQTAAIKEIAKQNKDPLAGAFRLGVIYTVGPYLLPSLVKTMIEQVPQMPLVLQENYTVKLMELLRQGELDAAIMALPLPDQGLMVQALYDEPFLVAVPHQHPWADRDSISAAELKTETMLLLGAGHCFRDQVLEVCPEMARFSTTGDGIARTFEGSSLETIRHMVTSASV